MLLFNRSGLSHKVPTSIEKVGLVVSEEIMAKIIKFPKEQRVSKQIQTLKRISDDIDKIIVSALITDGVDPHELAGLMAHRLGSLLRGFDDKSKTWYVCEKVLKKQAILEES